MATQVCPKCKKDAFAWHESDVLPDITVWLCSACPLQIFEDDSEEELCDNCYEVTKTFLQSQEEQFNWCANCNAVTNYQKNE